MMFLIGWRKGWRRRCRIGWKDDGVRGRKSGGRDKRCGMEWWRVERKRSKRLRTKSHMGTRTPCRNQRNDTAPRHGRTTTINITSCIALDRHLWVFSLDCMSLPSCTVVISIHYECVGPNSPLVLDLHVPRLPAPGLPGEQ
jgi:hypothetical protein